MLGQEQEVVHRVVAAPELLPVDDEGPVVDRRDPDDFLGEQLAVGDPALRVFTDFPSEQHVLRGDRRAVTPCGARLDLESRVDRLCPVGLGDLDRRAFLKARQLGAEHADQFPVLVEGREGPLGHFQNVVLGRHRIDAGMERSGKLDRADHQIVFRGSPARSKCNGQGTHQGDRGASKP